MCFSLIRFTNNELFSITLERDIFSVLSKYEQMFPVIRIIVTNLLFATYLKKKVYMQ